MNIDSQTLVEPTADTARGNTLYPHRAEAPSADADRMQRRTPRVSLIVVQPDNHAVSPTRLADRIRDYAGHVVQIVVACAGQPANLVTLQRVIGDAQFLLAPSGTSAEDLRELAMRQVFGDIVALIGGGPISEAGCDDAELLRTS